MLPGFSGFLGMLNDPANRGKLMQMAGGMLGNSGQDQIGGMLGMYGGMLDMRNMMSKLKMPMPLAPPSQPTQVPMQPPMPWEIY